MQNGNAARMGRAYNSLEGLSVGDSFGQTFFGLSPIVLNLLEKRATRAAPWSFTDDTLMALSIVSNLRQYGAINQEKLALSFAHRFDPTFGYGPAMFDLLPAIKGGMPWQIVAPSLFNGQGSFGNGAAMRVAPIGAYFAYNLEQTVEQAKLSAEITHSHPEAIAGAIAVAVATAWAYRCSKNTELPTLAAFLDYVLASVPASKVRDGILEARSIPIKTPIERVVEKLGSGADVSAQDTVPFVIWCAGQHLDNYPEAMWLTVSGLGDRDTTCAMVGGIVAAYTGIENIPIEWRYSRMALPLWTFEEGDH